MARDFVPRSAGVASRLQASVVPALRKKREGLGTHFVDDVGEIKNLGHPPQSFRAERRLHHASPPRQETTNDDKKGTNFTTTAPETSSSMLSHQAQGINQFTCVNLAGALQQPDGSIFSLAALISTRSHTATAGCCAAPVPG